MNSWHNQLLQKYSTYHHWHQHPRHPFWHWVVFSFIAIFVFNHLHARIGDYLNEEVLSVSIQTPQAQAAGNTYHVATTGSDANSCSQAQNISTPKRTINNALGCLSAGDTLYVRGGTYNEQVTITKSGSAGGGYITLRSYPGETGILDGTGLGGTGLGLIVMTDVSYFKIQNLEIRNIRGEAIWYRGSGSHIEITNNEIHHGNWPNGDTSGHAILFTSLKWPGPTFGAITYVTIANNNIHDFITGLRYENEVLSVVFNVQYFKITNNTITNFRNIGINASSDEVWGSYNTVGYPRYGIISGNTLNFGSISQFGENSGIYVNAVQDVVIENNYVYGGRCAGIVVGHEEYNTLTQARVIVRHNRVGDQLNQIALGGVAPEGRMTYTRVIHNSLWFSTNLSTGFALQNGGTSNIVKNNIQQQSGTYYHTRTNYGSSTFSFNYNLWYPNTGDGWNYKGVFYTFAGWQGIGQDVNGKAANPLMVDPANGNFNLQATSPAINAGGFLTTTSGSGSGASVVVNDPYYFTDGYGLQTGDAVQIGSNIVTVTNINYGTNTLTVSPSISWSNGAAVSYPYAGSAPDMGAYEYGGVVVSSPTPTPTLSPTLSPTPTPVPSSALSGLIAHWKFDEEFGSITTDSSGNGHTGTLVNGPIWTSGKINGALSFDGINDYVSLGSNALGNLGDAHTISFWVKATSDPDTQALVTEYQDGVCGDFQLLYGFDNKIYVGNTATGLLASNTTLSDGIWNLVTFTSDISNSYLYLNGIVDKTLADVDWLNNCSTTDVRIGSLAGSFFFNGSLDDLRVYNRALSVTEVKAIFDAVPVFSLSSCDLNQDTKTDILDFQLLANVILGLTANTGGFDINKDGQVNILDTQVLANVILGKTTCP